MARVMLCLLILSIISGADHIGEHNARNSVGCESRERHEREQHNLELVGKERLRLSELQSLDLPSIRTFELDFPTVTLTSAWNTEWSGSRLEFRLTGLNAGEQVVFQIGKIRHTLTCKDSCQLLNGVFMRAGRIVSLRIGKESFTFRTWSTALTITPLATTLNLTLFDSDVYTLTAADTTAYADYGLPTTGCLLFYFPPTSDLYMKVLSPDIEMVLEAKEEWQLIALTAGLRLSVTTISQIYFDARVDFVLLAQTVPCMPQPTPVCHESQEDMSEDNFVTAEDDKIESGLESSKVIHTPEEEDPTLLEPSKVYLPDGIDLSSDVVTDHVYLTEVSDLHPELSESGEMSLSEGIELSSSDMTDHVYLTEVSDLQSAMSERTSQEAKDHTIGQVIKTKPIDQSRVETASMTHIPKAVVEEVRKTPVESTFLLSSFHTPPLTITRRSMITKMVHRQPQTKVTTKSNIIPTKVEKVVKTRFIAIQPTTPRSNLYSPTIFFKKTEPVSEPPPLAQIVIKVDPPPALAESSKAAVEKSSTVFWESAWFKGVCEALAGFVLSVLIYVIAVVLKRRFPAVFSGLSTTLLLGDAQDKMEAVYAALVPEGDTHFSAMQTLQEQVTMYNESIRNDTLPKEGCFQEVELFAMDTPQRIRDEELFAPRDMSTPLADK